MPKRWTAVVALLALAVGIAPPVGSAGAGAPIAGTWSLTLRFTNNAFPPQTHLLVFSGDGRWSCAEWGMQGRWDRPTPYTLTLSGERRARSGVTEAFAVTGAAIRGGYGSISGSFVLWQQPAWAQAKWADGQFTATRQRPLVGAPGGRARDGARPRTSPLAR